MRNFDHGWGFSYGAGLSPGMRHDELLPEVVRLTQQALADLGYDPGPADGLAGTRTRAAIEAFERDHGLVVTGLLHEKVLALLAQESGTAIPIYRR